MIRLKSVAAKRTPRWASFKIPAAILAGAAALPTPSLAVRWAPPQHQLPVDRSIPDWNPASLTIAPGEELISVGGDSVDEITFACIKRFGRQYPALSVTMDARASKFGMPALIEGRAHMVPLGRNVFPAEMKSFVEKFGYPPTAIRVATGSISVIGQTATAVVLVAKENPIKGLSFAQLDAIYSKTRKRGHAAANTWGDLGLTGAWASRPIHPFGIRPPWGIEQSVRELILQDGEWSDKIDYVAGPNELTLAAKKIEVDTGGITYAWLPNVTPGVRVVPLAETEGGRFFMPTPSNIYSHQYPLSDYIYIVVNRRPHMPLEPKVLEFLKLVLSRQGQEIVAKRGIFIPLTPDIVKQESIKLQ